MNHRTGLLFIAAALVVPSPVSAAGASEAFDISLPYGMTKVLSVPVTFWGEDIHVFPPLGGPPTDNSSNECDPALYGYSDLYYSISVGGAYHSDVSGDPGVYGLPIDSDAGVAVLEVNRAYTFSVETFGVEDLNLKIEAPPGFTLSIDNQTVSEYQFNFDDCEELELISVSLKYTAEEAILPFKGAVFPDGDGVIWKIGLGYQPDGSYLGSIDLSEIDLSDSFDAGALRFTDDGLDVADVFEGIDRLKQIKLPWVLALVTEDTANDTYTLAFYKEDDFNDNGAGNEATVISGRSPYLSFDFIKKTNSKFAIERTEGSGTGAKETVYVIEEDANGDWVVDGGPDDLAANRVVRTEKVVDVNGDEKTVEVTIADASATVVTKRQETIKDITPTGSEYPQWVTTKVVEDYGAGNYTTAYTYYEDETAVDSFGRIKTATYPDGGWTKAVYGSTSATYGLITKRYEPYLDSPATPPSGEPAPGSFSGLMTEIAYSTADKLWGKATSVKQYIDGALVSWTESTYTLNPSDSWDGADNVAYDHKVVTKYHHGQGSGDAIKSTFKYYNQDATTPRHLRNKIFMRDRPDGTKVSYIYNWGEYDGAFTKSASEKTAYRVISFHGMSPKENGTAPPETGLTAINSYDGENLSRVYMLLNRSKMQVRIYGAAGLIREETHVFAGPGTTDFELIASKSYTYDDENNPTGWTDSRGRVYEQEWTNGRLTEKTYTNGVVSKYTYDALGRLKEQVKLSTNGGETTSTGAVFTTFTYNADGRLTSVKIEGDSGNEIERVFTYDKGRRLIKREEPDGRILKLGYYKKTGESFYSLVEVDEVDSGETTTYRTTTYDTHRDGRLKKRSGSAVVDTYYFYGVLGTGNQYVTVSNGGKRSTRIDTDLLGREVQRLVNIYRDDTNGHLHPLKVESAYGSHGYLQKISRKEYDSPSGKVLADELFEYDAMGDLYRHGLDVGGDGTLTIGSGNDRVTEITRQYWKDVDPPDPTYNWYGLIETEVYDTTDSSNKAHYGKVQSQLTGLGTTDKVANVEQWDMLNRKTTTTVTVDRTNKKVTENIAFYGVSNDASRITVNGLLKSVTNPSGSKTEVYFDSIERLWKEVDGRGIDREYEYVTDSTLIKKILGDDADGNRVTMAEFSYKEGGLVDWSKDVLGNTTYYNYNDRGQLEQMWGDAVNPASYTYSDYGELSQMNTYKDNIGGWDMPVWPTSGYTARTTTFTYDDASGLMTKKTDAANKSVSYIYDDLGRTTRVTTARGGTIDYTYFDDIDENNTGEIKKISYSDSSMKDIEYTYTRAGQLATVDDVTGLRSFTYDAISNSLRLKTETLPSSWGWNRNFSYDTYNRSSGFALKEGTTTRLSNTYAYEGARGRLASVTTSPDSPSPYTYGYLANSDLVESLTSGSSAFEVNWSWEPHRNLLEWIDTKSDGTSKAKYAYRSNDSGLRTDVTQTGKVFDRYHYTNESAQDVSGLVTRYAYNDRGELTGSRTSIGADPDEWRVALPGRTYGFGYDRAGNRKTKEIDEAGTSTNSSNSLNQLSGRSTPVRHGHISGFADKEAMVLVDGNYTYRQSDYFYHRKSVTGTTTSFEAKVQAAKRVGGTDYYAQETRKGYLPDSDQGFTYDEDGNLTGDEQWSYTYDLENRLVKMARSDGDIKRLEFTYDYLGRRVGKLTYTTTSGGSAQDSYRFIYHGWNLIAELELISGAYQIQKSFTWGLDVSGTMQGAGGVGGLLAIRDFAQSKTLNAGYDGNGNLTTLTDATSGAVEAAYEYSPYGEVIRATGDYAEENSFRFSTKWTDSESGLVYYGFRYYSPDLGRFINRDPIGESGGANLYGFVGNNPVNSIDFLGLSEDEDEEKKIKALPRTHPEKYKYNARMYDTGATLDRSFKIRSQIENLNATTIEDVVLGPTEKEIRQIEREVRRDQRGEGNVVHQTLVYTDIERTLTTIISLPPSTLYAEYPVDIINDIEKHLANDNGPVYIVLINHGALPGIKFFGEIVNGKTIQQHLDSGIGNSGVLFFLELNELLPDGSVVELSACASLFDIQAVREGQYIGLDQTRRVKLFKTGMRRMIRPEIRLIGHTQMLRYQVLGVFKYHVPVATEGIVQPDEIVQDF